MMASRKALFIFILVAGTCSPSHSLDRQKRSFVQFGNMIECVNGNTRDASDYNGYGCWCGSGGSGTPVDSIDSCCRTHDNCWDTYSDDDDCTWHASPYLEVYAYTCGVGTVNCALAANDACERQLCECDRAAALCFNSNTFNTAYEDYSGSC